MKLGRKAWNRIKHNGYAPPGTTFLCGACGKTGPTIGSLGSCLFHGLLVYEDKRPDGKYQAAGFSVQTWVFRAQAHKRLSGEPEAARR